MGTTAVSPFFSSLLPFSPAFVLSVRSLLVFERWLVNFLVYGFLLYEFLFAAAVRIFQELLHPGIHVVVVVAASAQTTTATLPDLSSF